jgi:hypothetical protein
VAVCPFAYRELMLTQPGSYKVGANGPDIVRIVVHHTGVKQNQVTSHARSAWYTWTAAAKAGKMVSAHFVIEINGQIYQTVDTADVAYGTAEYTRRAIHIEHAGNNEPFTRAQLHASALLIAWIRSFSPGLSLDPVGTGLADFGDRDQEGMTCHAFLDLAAIKFGKPYAPKQAKITCPGTPMMGSLAMLSLLARNYAAAVPTVTSPVAVTAASFFDWSGGSNVPL